MVFEIANILTQDYDKETLSVKVPRVFDCFKTQDKDADIEIVTSPTLQPLRLMYNYNKVTNKIAHIFVNSRCLD